MILSEQERNFFEIFGFLRFDGLLKDRVDEITEAFEEVWARNGDGHYGNRHDGEKRSCIVPFIDQHERLCSLLDDPRITGILEGLLGSEFDYCSSDGNLYVGNTKWHSHPFFGNLRAVKVAFYLDPLDADSGCLRVIPGSQFFGGLYANRLHEFLPQCREALGRDPVEMPSVPLPTVPGDVLVFNHCIKHGSFGGGQRRRLFVINSSERFPEDKISELERMVAGLARFWNDQFYGQLMIDTAGPDRMRHLEQVLAHQAHLPALAAKARQEMLEPSRG